MSHKPEVDGASLQTLIGLLAMILVHSFLVITRGIGHKFSFQDLSLLQSIVLGTGIISFGLPAVAAIRFYDRIQAYLVDGKLRNFPASKFAGLMIFICVLECVKNGLAYGQTAIFQWDAIHCITLSFFLIILTLLFLRIEFLYVFFCLILIGLFFFKAPAANWMIYPSDISLYFFDNKNIFFILTVLLLILLLFFLLWWTFLKKMIFFQHAPKMWFVVYIFFVISTLSQVYYEIENSKTIAAFFWNLPTSILIQNGQLGGHLWPLFPWFGLVMAGFLIQHLFKSIKMKKFFIFMGLGISGLVFCAFVVSSYKIFINLLSESQILTAQLYAPRFSIFIGMLSFFLFIYFLCQIVVFYFKPKSEFIRDFSEAILFIYIIHSILANYLARGFVQIWPKHESIIYVYPFLILFLTIGAFYGYKLYVPTEDRFDGFKKRNI